MLTRVIALSVVVMAVAGLSGSRISGQERVVVSIVAERFTFTPSEIRIPVGATLELRVRSEDTMHGFRIVGHQVDVSVPKRRQGEAVVVFEAPRAGTYRFECSRLCGAGHNFMRGEIVVGDVEAPARDVVGDVEAPARDVVGDVEATARDVVGDVEAPARDKD